MMNLLYIGCFVTSSQESSFVSKKTKITMATTSFQKMFLSGFRSVNYKPEIINAADIGSWPKRSKMFNVPASEEVVYGLNCTNVKFSNLTLYKQFSIYKSIYTAGEKFLKSHENEQTIVIVYSLIYSYIRAAVELKRKYPKVKICCIVLDLPEYFGDSKSLLYRLFDKTKKIYKISKEIDSFVLLTEYMCRPLKLGKRSWLLMEGVYNNSDVIKTEKKSLKTVLYTGKLDSRFGIKMLLKVFSKIEDVDAKLWICGDGTERKYVEEMASKDERIIYYGIISQSEVFRLQRIASLLINPRSSDGEYTKYSFPSKTMEYMASGTPTLMYRLPGMPKEYFDKVVLFKDSSEETFCNVLEEWLNKPQNELDAFGDKARKFILENKTAEKQVARFVNFLTDNYGD